jgi:hypothetical protein
MKTILKLLLCVVAVLAFNQKTEAQQFAYFDQYNSLYPDCHDDEMTDIHAVDEPFLEEPLFPGGGQVQMTRYVYFNTEYPNVAGPDGEQLKGKVLVKTVIDRCGRATRAEVIQSLSDQQDAEALRIVQGFPIFKPGSLDGDRVKVAIVVPVYFTKTIRSKAPETDSNQPSY